VCLTPNRVLKQPSFPGVQCGQMRDYMVTSGDTTSYLYISIGYDSGTGSYGVWTHTALVWTLGGFAAVAASVKADYCDAESVDLITSWSSVRTGSAGITGGGSSGIASHDPQFGTTFNGYFTTQTSTYNFLGNPLSSTSQNSTVLYGQQTTPPPVNTKSTAYAYLFFWKRASRSKRPK
jgi:hypothetical protein